MAELWGRKIAADDSAKAQSDHAAILKCDIPLGHCLNLADTRWLFILKNFGSKIIALGHVFERTNTLGDRGHHLEGEYHHRYLDHEFIDLFIEHTGDTFDSVLGVFENGKPIIEGAGIYLYNSIQVAVRSRASAQIQTVAIDTQ